MKNWIYLVLLLFLGKNYIARSQVIEGVGYSERVHVDNTFDMYGEDIFGQRFPSESFPYKDDVTGKEIISLTTSRHHNAKMYQTHPQWTSDGKYIIFASDRMGEENIMLFR